MGRGRSSIFRIVVLIVASTVLAVLGCASHAQPQRATQPSSSSASYIAVRSLEELVDKSTVIVVGQMTDKGGVFNFSRDVNDLTRPDPNRYGVAQIYHFEVERYIKGDGHAILNVVQSEGVIHGDSASVTAEQISDAQRRSAQDQTHVPIRADTRYLLFLRPLGGFEREGYLTGTAHPFRFVLEGAEAKPESPWSGATVAFPPTRAEALLGQVEALVQAEGQSSER